MKINLSILMFLITVLLSSNSVYSQKWDWVKKNGNNIVGNDASREILPDSEGNICLVGLVKGNNEFGEPGDYVNPGAYGTHDILLEKYDSDGTMLWVRRHGSTSTDQSTGFSLDNEDNWYAGGYFGNQCNFGDTVLSTSNSSLDCFVISVNADGEFRWIFSFGDQNNDRIWSLDGDSYGNSYVTGYFSGTMQFGSQSLTSFGGDDIFVAKVDSMGNPSWIKQFGSIENDLGSCIILEDSTLYVAGTFRDEAIFGSETISVSGSNSSTSDAFLCKLDIYGNVEWVRGDGGGGNDFGITVDVDDDGNIVYGGSFRNNADFGPSNEFSHLSQGEADIFLANYASNGDIIKVLRFGASGLDDIQSINYSKEINKFLIGGRFQDTLIFQGMLFESEGPKDLFVMQFNDTLGLEWKKQIKGVPYGGKDPNIGSMYADSLKNVYVTGGFLTPVYFDTILLTPHPINKDIFYGMIRPKVEANMYTNTDQVCQFDSIQFYNNSTYNATTFEWQFEGGSPTTSNDENPVVSFNQSGIYDVSLIVGGDDQSDTIYFNDYVNIVTQPFIDLGVDTTMCEGESIILDAGNHFSYEWNTDEETQTIIVDSTSNYSVIVNNEFGCFNTDSIGVLVFDLPSISLGNDTILCEGEILGLNVEGDYMSVNWNTGDTTETIIIDSEGVYSVIVQDLNMCYNSDEIQVEFEVCVGINEINMDNYISLYPNPSNGIINVKILEEIDRIAIYDQRGRRVFLQIGINSNTYSSDLSSLNRGLYYLEVITESERIIREKVILQK